MTQQSDKNDNYIIPACMGSIKGIYVLLHTPTINKFILTNYLVTFGISDASFRGNCFYDLIRSFKLDLHLTMM